MERCFLIGSHPRVSLIFVIINTLKVRSNSKVSVPNCWESPHSLKFSNWATILLKYISELISDDDFTKHKHDYASGFCREMHGSYLREIVFRLHYRACHLKDVILTRNSEIPFGYITNEDTILSCAVNAFLVKLYETQNKLHYASCSMLYDSKFCSKMPCYCGIFV